MYWQQQLRLIKKSWAAVVSAVRFATLLGHETDSVIKTRVIGKEDVNIAEMIKKLGNSDWVTVRTTPKTISM